MRKEQASLVLDVAVQFRGEKPIPVEFVVEALDRIERGVEVVTYYPMGAPSAKQTYDIAKRLHAET